MGAPTLHVMCGKIASGKSTLATQLAKDDGAVLISEDAWLKALFGDQMKSLADFVRCSEKLRSALGPHITALLNSGLPVVLDFAANTIEQRAWMNGVLEGTTAAGKLHLLDLPDDVLLERLRVRNASGEHPFAATEEQFHRVSRHFVAPTPREGFEIIFHRPPA